MENEKLIYANVHNFKAINKDAIVAKTAVITNTIWKNMQELTVKELMKEIGQGKTTQFGIFEDFESTVEQKNPSDENLSEQIVIAIDVDNQKLVDKKDTYGNVLYAKNGNTLKTKAKLTKEEGYLSLEEAKNIKDVCFLYKTFSYSEDWERFRLVFVLSESLTNNAQVTELLVKKFKEINSKAVDLITNSNRLFYGSADFPTLIDEDAEINVEEYLGKDWENISEVSKETQQYLEEHRKNESTNEPKKRIQTNIFSNVVNKEVSSSLKNWQLMEMNTKEADEELKKRFKDTKLEVNDEKQFYELLKRSNLKQILELPVQNTFIDILHDESNASASVKVLKNGVSLYTVFSDTKVFWDRRSSNKGDIFEVVRTLKNFETRKKTISYLIEITGTTLIESEAVKQFRLMIEEYTQYDLLNTEENLEIYPEFSKIFYGYHKHLNIIQILREMAEAVWWNQEKSKYELMNYFSLRTLSMKLFGTEHKAKDVGKLINWMAFVGMLKKLEAKDIPADLLDRLNNNRKGNHKRSSVYMPVLSNLEDMNTESKVLLENGFTWGSFNNDFIARLGDLDKFKELNPTNSKARQVKSTEELVSKYGKWLESKIVPYIFKELEENGYIIEMDLIEAIKNEILIEEAIKAEREGRRVNTNKGLSEKRWRGMRKDILEKYNLDLIRANKELKEKYELMDRFKAPQSKPNLIIKKED